MTRQRQQECISMALDTVFLISNARCAAVSQQAHSRSASTISFRRMISTRSYAAVTTTGTPS
jgi:hypothetical protein